MGYGLSDRRYRIGWVIRPAREAPAFLNWPSPTGLPRPSTWCGSATPSPTTVFEIQPGGTFQVLATQQDGYYAYIRPSSTASPTAAL